MDTENFKFDGRNKKWTLDSEYQLQPCKKGRLINYEKIKKEWEKSCHINIDQRIGMESTMGEVFKIYKNESFLAAKILPIINDNSFKNNEKEIRFAIEASELVLNNKSIYFPIVYDFELCNETYFHTENNAKFKSFALRFYDKSLRYQQFIFLLNSNIDNNIKEKILNLKNKKLMNPDEIIEKLNLNIKLPDKIQSHLLFSELACFDLNFYLDNFQGEKFLSEILTFKNLHYLLLEIFLAIKDMTIKLNLLHNDLHLGNILLINDENSEIGYIPLIHDFGKSRKLKFNELGDIEYYDKQHDLFFFLGKFEEKINDLNILEDSKILKNTLSEVIDVFNESKEIFPILDVIKYWKNLDFENLIPI